ncbi:leukocyte immunoglobulin-like receptor subfamily B member 5 isoform X3 [Pseudopipra pipra]|uniref:leukocyte immunoglobulin-like receptor subfamily B member 5 isoform X3 n=1 Tax=Pseudopipra pipra TaxID=415032 RepID=UPI0031394558
MLPVTHVLAFGECQRLCRLPEGGRRHPETSHRCYTASSLAGAWLVAQSKATPNAPTISIFLKPPGVIPPGGSTTICCSCQHGNGNFMLYKDGHQLRTLEQSGSRAEFSISNATYKDTGTYNCHYLEGGTVLARSDGLDVVVTGIRLPGPDLSVLPGHEVTAGTHVIFRCTPPHRSTGCFLYLEGQIRAQVLSREQDDYNFSHVQEGEGGRYSCQCFTKNASIEWSAVSKTLDLVVRDYTLCNAVRLALGAGLLVLLGLITAEATRGRCCRGGRAHPLPAGSAPLTATSVGTPGFPSRASRWDK